MKIQSSFLKNSGMCVTLNSPPPHWLDLVQKLYSSRGYQVQKKPSKNGIRRRVRKKSHTYIHTCIQILDSGSGSHETGLFWSPLPQVIFSKMWPGLIAISENLRNPLKRTFRSRMNTNLSDDYWLTQCWGKVEIDRPRNDFNVITKNFCSPNNWERDYEKLGKLPRIVGVFFNV